MGSPLAALLAVTADRDASVFIQVGRPPGGVERAMAVLFGRTDRSAPID
jgi:hypothetical protein